VAKLKINCLVITPSDEGTGPH